jgi:hypothetical protein
MDKSIPSIYIPIQDGSVVAINQEDLPEVEDIIELLRGFSTDLDPWVQVVKMYLAQVRISPANFQLSEITCAFVVCQWGLPPWHAILAGQIRRGLQAHSGGDKRAGAAGYQRQGALRMHTAAVRAREHQYHQSLG